MSDSNEQPDAITGQQSPDQSAAAAGTGDTGNTEQSTDTGAAAPVAVSQPETAGLSGEVAQGEVGSVQAAAAPAGTPILAKSPEGLMVQGAGIVTDEQLAAMGYARIEDDEDADGEAQSDGREVVDHLHKIEQHALFMGGEIGTKIRNSVCRVRLLLTGRSDHQG